MPSVVGDVRAAHSFVALDGALFFSADNDALGRELWSISAVRVLGACHFTSPAVVLGIDIGQADSFVAGENGNE